MKSLYWSCVELLTLGAQFASDASLPAPDALRRQLDTLFEQMAAKSLEAGATREDVSNAQGRRRVW